MINALDVESVDRDAAFGADPSEGDVKAVVVDGLGEKIQKADLVFGLNLDDGTLHRKLMVDVYDGRERTMHGLARRNGYAVTTAVLTSLCCDVGIEIFVGYERLFDGFCESFHRDLILNYTAVGLDDVEGVDSDVIGAGDDLGAENIQTRHAEGTGELVEQAGAVPRDDVDDGEATIEVVLPVDDRLERADGIGGGNRVEQLIHHLDVQRNLAAIGVDEVTLRQQIKMRRDFIRADAGDGFGDQFLMLHLRTLGVSGFGRFTVDQTLERGAEEGGVKSVFIAVPEPGRRPAGIAKRVDVEIA